MFKTRIKKLNDIKNSKKLIPLICSRNTQIFIYSQEVVLYLVISFVAVHLDVSGFITLPGVGAEVFMSRGEQLSDFMAEVLSE